MVTQIPISNQVSIVGGVEKPGVYVRYFGGLGNQLFQYSFAKYLESELEIPTTLLRSRIPLRADRKFDLDDFLTFRQEIATYPRYSIPTYGHPMIQRLNARLEKVGMNSVNLERDPFGLPSVHSQVSSRPVLYSGYFQNNELVSKAAKLYIEDLKAFLAPIAVDVRTRLDLPLETPVIHVRRGDLLNSENVHMGLLSSDFYTQALSAQGITGNKAIILTDDIQNSKELARELGVASVYAPEAVSTWEAIAIFSTSHSLVTSNSTLSWWGGYLGSTQGNQVAMPRTWFKDKSVKPETALHISGATLIESSFY
jgi:hypothetical protein